MEKQTKIYTAIIVMLLLVGVTLLFLTFKEYRLAFLFGALLVVDVVYLANLLLTSRDLNQEYHHMVTYILKTYSTILVKSKNLINLNNKTVIYTDNIEDLVNAQIELRKPIYYKQYKECTIFTLIDNQEAIVYEVKANEEVISPLRELQKNNKENKNTIDLTTIKKTTIVEMNDKNYKISPIEKKVNKEAQE